MSTGTPPPLEQAFATLRQFARPRPAVERCELCSAGLAHEHPHLVEIVLAADRLRLRCLRDPLRWNGREGNTGESPGALSSWPISR